MGSSPVAATKASDFTPSSSKEFLEIQATIECRFTMKRVRDMTRTYNQLYPGILKFSKKHTDGPLTLNSSLNLLLSFY